MKKIMIVLEEKSQDYPAGIFIRENIYEVLGDTVFIDICYLKDIEVEDFSNADLILVMVPKLLHEIYNRFQNDWGKEKTLLVSRTLNQRALAKILQIPAGERVLVVNRLQDTTDDLIKLLYELEVIHLDLVPYHPGDDIGSFRYMITAGVLDLQASYTGTVINVGFRQLGTQAFLDIFSRLNIRDPQLLHRLHHYIQSLPAKYNDVEKRYFQSQMMDKTLEKVMEQSDFGVLVTDVARRVLYRNQKAVTVFQTELIQNEPLTLPESPAVVDRLFDEDFRHELLKIHGEYVMVERHKLDNTTEPMGFYFECQTAKSIRSMDHKLSEKLRKSGFYAKYTFDDIVYLSPEMRHCMDVAKQLARTNYSILITGESGSGKEMFAQSIHNASERNKEPFIAVNCAAFPENLLESELFGYEGGSFTGSKREGKIGLFELANKGSIFLDEIGDMPLSLQAKLLRALQEKKIMRVGSDHLIDIDIRILSASNKNLMEEIAQKNFRADLYYRLAAFTIQIPPLRNRKEDILPLFQVFSTRKANQLTTDEKRILLSYHWPGNVRELQNAAAYFDVIGTVKVMSSSQEEAASLHGLVDIREARRKLLDLLERYSDMGLGRGRLLVLLKEEGVPLSEKRFEQLIEDLLREQLIYRGRGRQGIRLTEAGRQVVQRQNHK